MSRKRVIHASRDTFAVSDNANTFKQACLNVCILQVLILHLQQSSLSHALLDTGATKKQSLLTLAVLPESQCSKSVLELH